MRDSKHFSIIITVICVILLVGIITSYAYFIGSFTNIDANLSTNTGSLSLVFSDGNNGINETLTFGESISKTFSIENNGSIDAIVRINWDNLINTYLEGSLTYSLSYSDIEDGEYTNKITNKNLPISASPIMENLSDDLIIPTETIYYYKLTITLNNQKDIDQTVDLNAKLSTNFSLEDRTNFKVNTMMARGSSTYNGEFWSQAANIKTIVFENRLNPKSNAEFSYDISETKDKSVMSYLVPTEEDDTKYTLYIQSNGELNANVDSSHLFNGFTNLTNIEGFRYFDTSSTTNMSSMFYNCNSLTMIDLSNFDTNNVIDMSYIFYNCSGLTSLNVSNFDTRNVTYMSSMFQKCAGLTSLDVSNFNTSKVTTISYMFYNCTGLTSLNVSNFDTSRVTSMASIFSGCTGLTSLDVSNFDTSRVTTMASMFSNCSGLTSLNISNFNTSKVTSMNSMFSSCTGLTSIDVSNFITSKVTNMSYMFSNCTGLTSLDVSNFNTSKVTNMNRMFQNCSNIKTLNLSNFDTSNVTNMKEMFMNSIALISLNVNSFNTSNVTNMKAMFKNCSSLTTLNLSSFNTEKIKTDDSTGTGIQEMFRNCSSLTSIDVSNFNTSSITSFEYMFNGCSSLTTLDLSNFDTSNITKMRYMFDGCSNLTTLNISNFNTSKVTSMYWMFNDCRKLTTTLTIRGTKCSSYANMFKNAATDENAKIIVNYTAETSSKVDRMINTKSDNSHVEKGDQIEENLT